MKKEFFFNLLSKSSFLMVNKHLAKKYNLNCAVIIADLISKEKYFTDNKTLDNDGYFYNTHDNINRDTTLSRHQQAEALRILEKDNIITILRKGVPCKNHFKVNYDRLLQIFNTDFGNTPGNQLADNLATSQPEIKQQVVKKVNGNNNKNDNNNNNKNKELFIDFIPDKFKCINFMNHWKEWIIYRKERKKNIVKSTAIKQLEKLAKYDDIVAGAMINQSIIEGWTGLFPLKKTQEENTGDPYKDKWNSLK